MKITKKAQENPINPHPLLLRRISITFNSNKMKSDRADPVRGMKAMKSGRKEYIRFKWKMRMIRHLICKTSTSRTLITLIILL